MLKSMFYTCTFRWLLRFVERRIVLTDNNNGFSLVYFFLFFFRNAFFVQDLFKMRHIVFVFFLNIFSLSCPMCNIINLYFLY